MNAPVMYIDSTEYPLVKGPQGGNRTVRTLSVQEHPTTKKNTLRVEWWVDGSVKYSWCDLYD